MEIAQRILGEALILKETFGIQDGGGSSGERAGGLLPPRLGGPEE